jgi:hypothetical protein
MGPGLWAPKRAGEDAQRNPGPEGILAKGKAGAPTAADRGRARKRAAPRMTRKGREICR